MVTTRDTRATASAARSTQEAAMVTGVGHGAQSRLLAASHRVQALELVEDAG